MLDQREEAIIDIQYLLPSCVPATPEDVGGASLQPGISSRMSPVVVSGTLVRG